MKNKPTIFVLSMFLCMCSSLYSKNGTSPPPINDICTGAIDLGLLDCGFYAQYDEDLEATPDPEATGNCIDNTEPGQWYTFTTPDPIPYNSILLASTWVDVEVFSTTTDCSALIFEDCGTGQFAFEPEAGTKYYYLATGGFHMSIPFGGLSTCDDPLVSYSSCDGPIHIISYTDCAWSSDVVQCPNDHVIWFDYTAGNSGSDVIISVEEFSLSYGNTAGDISISVFADDCATLLYGFDAAGFGYRCSVLETGQSITLEDLPPGFHVKIAVSSGLNDAGHFDLFIDAVDEEPVSNDFCDDAEVIFEGISWNLSNVCATEDLSIAECPPQSEATVWFEYDPGTVPQDIEITLYSTGITSPAIAVYDNCWGSLVESVCGTSIELFCIDYPIFIQIGSSDEDVGTFNLEIESNPSISSLDPEITGSPICSNSEAGIFISIPSGEIVNILVEISTASSGLITGMNNQLFTGVNSAMIKDSLINSSTEPEEAIYTITIESFGNVCPTDPVEFSILVYPEFKINEVSVEGCAPYLLELDAFDIIEGGTEPYLGILWFWSSSNLVGTTNVLSLELVESGQITLKIVDYVGCREEVKIDVDITIPIDPTFDFDLTYCRTSQDTIGFPMTSLEGIEGAWSPSSFDLELNTEDAFYDILFTPNEEYCSNPVIDSIQIYSGDVPEFELPDILCEGEESYIFPTLDQNGIQGTWDVPSLDLSNFEGVFANTFSHNYQGCMASFEYEFIVEPKIVLNFGQPDSLCRFDEPYVLSIISDEGYEGSWDVPIIEPSLVLGNTFTSTWTPNALQSLCLKDTSITIQIVDAKIPEFILPDELCTLDSTFTFPTIDNYSISGTWSIPSINPAALTGSIQSIFTSDEYCIEMFTWQIQIIDPLIPEFNIDTSICSHDPVFDLPLVSDNGITGTWSVPTIDPLLIAGEEVVIVFQGDLLGPCVKEIELIIHVEEAQDVIFELPDMVCWKDEEIVLPILSSNGIEGNWNPPILAIQANIGNTISSIFTPLDSYCSNGTEQNIEILLPYEVEVIEMDPSDCAIEDGSIFIDVIQGSNLEYSIDGGTNWQSSTMFNFLSPGAYTILVRSIDLIACQLSIEASLSSSDGPVINEVSSFDISSCVVDNGSVTIEAEGNNLEYSIDGGNTWQESNEFDNLPAGDYIISIHEAMSDCIEEVEASITDFLQTEIINVTTQDISDCSVNDGLIDIVAQGEALEYSIDNGVNWFTQSTFNNLADGEYIIIVQSTQGEDCDDTLAVQLTAPDFPSILNVNIENPTLCFPSKGRIEIDAQGNNLEYSIDGSLTWQNSNIFSELESDTYTLIVRDSLRINCFDEILIEVMLEDESLPESTIVIIPPTECEATDGAIDLTNSLEGIEYSKDDGMSWQTTNIFDNLSSGMYTVIIRKILLPECYVIQSIEMPTTDCPCSDLSLEFEITNILCTGEDSARVELISILGMTNPTVDIQWQTGAKEMIIEGVGEGWQIITISYDDDCIWIDSLWVELVEPIQYEWYTENLDCPESENGTIEIVNVSGGNGLYEYSMDGSTYQLENIFKDLEEGEYGLFVRDDDDCVTQNEVEVFSNPIIEIHLPEIENIIVGDKIFLDPRVNPMQIDSFVWTPLNGILNPNKLVIEVAPKETTIYTLDIYYGECLESREITIEVSEKEEIYLGNVFSPNGDSINDVLYIQGKSNSTIVVKDFSVYDRWGNMVFIKPQPEFNNKTDGWDGKFQGELAMSGVFAYLINYIQDGQSQVKYGTITLLY